MAITRTAQRLLSAIQARYRKRRSYAELMECDAHILKDIGLRWERGRLVPLNPEREFDVQPSRDASETPELPLSCPRCGARLA